MRKLQIAATALVLVSALAVPSKSDAAATTATGSSSTRTNLFDVSGAWVGYVQRCCPTRWLVYKQNELTGFVIRAARYRGRWNVYRGASGASYPGGASAVFHRAPNLSRSARLTASSFSAEFTGP
jgi:hypothetical protein